MKRKIILTSRFKRSFKKFIKGNSHLQKQIETTLQEMEVDPYPESCSSSPYLLFINKFFN